jgi:threonine dehydrogenase-like Zn-dependent dehydrogenase
MKALVFGGPGQRSWDSAEDPGIVDPTDVIVTVPTLLKLARDGRIQSEKLGTHRFALSDIEAAYDVFGAADEHNALKVVLTG